MVNGPQLSKEQKERLHKFAHDLKNRLAGLHQVLKHTAGNTEGENAEFLEYGEQQFFKALRGIEDLLDDLRVERGEQRFATTTVPLAEVVKEAAEDLRFRFQNKDQELRFELDEDLKVKGDPHFIRETVTALLSNASKFSPRESPVDVVLEKKDGAAELCVIDHGVGLNEDDLRRIFTRYAWLGSKSTDGESQGRGTLAKARHWAEGMNGTLLASSEGEGRGCSFSLRLPLA